MDSSRLMRMRRVEVIETVPLRIPDGELEINADASGGQISVEVLTADGQVQSGFSLDECVPMTADNIRHSVQWKSARFTHAAQPLAGSVLC